MARAAKAGDRLVLVSCHGETAYVIESMRDDWTCKRCRGRGAGHVVVVLGTAGAEPVAS